MTAWLLLGHALRYKLLYQHNDDGLHVIHVSIIGFECIIMPIHTHRTLMHTIIHAHTQMMHGGQGAWCCNATRCIAGHFGDSAVTAWLGMLKPSPPACSHVRTSKPGCSQELCSTTRHVRHPSQGMLLLPWCLQGYVVFSVEHADGTASAAHLAHGGGWLYYQGWGTEEGRMAQTRYSPRLPEM